MSLHMVPYHSTSVDLVTKISDNKDVQHGEQMLFLVLVCLVTSLCKDQELFPIADGKWEKGSGGVLFWKLVERCVCAQICICEH